MQYLPKQSIQKCKIFNLVGGFNGILDTAKERLFQLEYRPELLLPLGNLGTIPAQGHVKLNSELEVFLASVICAVKLCETL